MGNSKLGIAVVQNLRYLLWEMEVSANGEAWILARDLELEPLLPDSIGWSRECLLVGLADDAEILFMHTPGGLQLVNMRRSQVSMKKKVDGTVQSVVPFITYCLPALR